MSKKSSIASNRKINKSGVRNIIRSVLYVILHALIFFIAAGTINILRGWVLWCLDLGTTILNLIIIAKVNPELLNQRGKMQKGTKSWDKAILASWVLLLVVIDIVAGLDVGRFHWTYLNFTFAIIGIIFWIVATILANWAEIINAYFEASVRIQKDREHQVITSGPYKFVRHPGYISVILSHLAFPLILGSILTFIPVGIIIVLFIIRTYLEDKTLQNELNGYSEYVQKVKYKLIPGIW